MPSDGLLSAVSNQLSDAVSFFWQTRSLQQDKQKQSGRRDAGSRGSVTGGAHMNGFVTLIAGLVVAAGIDEKYVYQNKQLELPGYFRPTKEWDLLVVIPGNTVVAIEVKSQVGPSFGNNFNNRTEEAMGSALDLWTAFREGALEISGQPFLGYLFMLEDCEASQRPVRVREPHFHVLPEFVGSSYLQRYELFCRKLVLERHYTASAFITSNRETGLLGSFSEPADDLRFIQFAKRLVAHIGAYS